MRTMRGLLQFCLATSLFAMGGDIMAGESPLIPTHLRCEYLENPRGIDVQIPRLSWEFEPTLERGKFQKAYEILVASDPALLEKDQGDLWASGKVESARTILIPYAGKALNSYDTCYWKARVWDEKGEASPWSKGASWSMGILHPEEWTASWIGGATEGALPVFRHEFDLNKKVKSAVLMVCGLGHYEVRLNGEKVGDAVIDPGWTNYRKTCLYSTYDIAGQLREGKNALGALLGNGMYNVKGGRYIKGLWSFGDPKIIVQARIVFEDGSILILGSGPEWKTAPGPIQFSCVYGGEDYDARKAPAGWDAPNFKEGPEWVPVSVVDGPGGALKAQMNAPNKVMRRFQPVAAPTRLDQGWLYDFGHNFSGWFSVKIKGAAGSAVKFHPAEWLRDGKIDQSQSGGPMHWQYTLNGAGNETWTPRFTYYGFRWIYVEGALPSGQQGDANLPIIEELTGEGIWPDIEEIGDFKCDNEIMNKTHLLIWRSMVSNIKSVFTDCPHREKLGWLEETHLVGPGLLFNFDLHSIYRKMANDISDTQLDNGLVPDIAPEYTVFSAGFRDSPEWGSAYILSLWMAYQRYGDREILARHYEGMKRYVQYLESKSANHIISHGLGDWFDIGPNGVGESQLTPKGITATAIYYEDILLLEKIAGLLGHAEESAAFRAQGEEIKAAFNQAFYNPESHQYATGSQTSNAMPLLLGLVPDNHEEAVLNNLIADIRAHNTHTTAGDVGHRYVLQALAKYGRSEIVFEMATREDHPSYGYQVKNGATSLTEAWDGPTRGVSQNHFMLGHIDEWYYQDLAGIQYNLVCGATCPIKIAPQVVPRLNWAEAKYRSVQGWIESRWERDGEALKFTIQVPPNTEAILSLPVTEKSEILEGGKSLEESGEVQPCMRWKKTAALLVPSGKYQFTVSDAKKKTEKGAAPAVEIDMETVKKWSEPFRNWHYHPDFVLPPSPADGLNFKSIDCPTVWQKGDEWRMWYTGFDGNGYQTALAVSQDLVNWTPKGLSMGYGKAGSYDYGGVAFGGPLFESYDIKGSRQLKKWQGKYWVLYGCYPKQGGYEIRPGAEGAAWSEDGETWNRLSEDKPILSVEGAAEWEKDCIYEPWLLEADGKFWDFYNAANGSREQMGFATSSDLANWARYPGNPVVRNRPDGYDAEFCSDGKVLRDGDHWVMLYFGVGKGGAHIMAAFSRDLVHWTSDPEPLYKSGGNPSGLDQTYAHKVSLVYNPKNDTLYLYYCAVGPKGRGIGLITSKPIEGSLLH